MFSPKVEKVEYDKLLGEHEELKKKYGVVIAKSKKAIEVLEKKNRELERQLKQSGDRKRKLEVYISRFLKVIQDLDEQNKIYEDGSGEYECCRAEDFKEELKKMKVNVNETLKVFRELEFIRTDKGAYTTTRRIEGKVQRVIAYRVEKDRLLRELWEKV